MSGETGTVIFPAFERLRYFHGQMLAARDFRAEQDYVREKTKLLTRCLHGYGVVCGLDVEMVLAPDYCAETDSPATEVRISPGMAIDCAGNLLLLGADCVLDLARLLDPADRLLVEQGKVDRLYLSICYCERGIEPTRPVVSHTCATAESCEHARIQESVSFQVKVEAPAIDDRCDTCCEPCGDDCTGGCVLLATIDLPVANSEQSGGSADALTVDNGVRRMLARHELTTIVGINWHHSASYGVSAASQLARSGFVIELSDSVRVESLRPGVVDVMVYQGGKGNVGGIYYATGGIQVPSGQEWTKEIVWCSDSDETFQNGDRVLVTIRGDHVLDRCCHPIDADHTGGRVPPSAAAVEPVTPVSFEGCLSPPDRSGPWRSGNGTPGGTFESWLYVTTDAGETT